jgi:tetratricopeptide (TPR) repeat protein
MFRNFIFILCVAVSSSANSETKQKSHNQNPQKTTSKSRKSGPLVKSGFQEILDRYLFIADFNEKQAERPISNEIFWRYPFKLAPQTFEFSLDKEQMDDMAFRVPGDGKLAEIFARGRVEYLNGDYDKAHATWLGGRQQFNDNALTNKRFEFLLALTAAQSLRKEWRNRKGNLNDPEIKRLANRLSYFLAATYILKRDIPDKEIERHAPWGLYNLAAAYYGLERWALVYGSAQEGLSILLKQGRKEFRPKFRQMLAEVYIKNQDLLPAIQELDTAIRQDPAPSEAARMFHRAGDIYFGLNNYELADEVYSLGTRVDETRTYFNPTQTLLRGESLFWLGKFESAKKMVETAIETSISRENDWLTVSQSIPWARLRVADLLLAMAETAKDKEKKDLTTSARLAYFKVESEHPNTEAARIAEVRGACMSLPSFEGNNIKHGRDVLESVKIKKDVPEILMELVEACLVFSYTDREKSEEMVARVKKFSESYPDSKYLDKMIPSVRDVQATNIEPYFQKNQPFLATEFFEKRRKTLYPVVSDELSIKLFDAYVDTNRSDKAEEFWPKMPSKNTTLARKIQSAVFLSDVLGKNPKGSKSKTYQNQLANIISELEKTDWKGQPSKKVQGYLPRLLNTKYSSKHLIWIHRASAVWAKDDKDYTCGILFPLTARIADSRSDATAKVLVKQSIEKVLPSAWQKLEGENATCAQSWLDLEAKSYSVKEKQAKYAKRADWPLKGPWLERLWVHSEDLERSGNRNDAKVIWDAISKNAPAESFESKMAKTRLDPSQTEVESLWK